ncbi:hypothetical protein BD410DRAFT_86243 [Rickenella mellea]|uniref:Mitochondrial adapter protein MCP1 transmembrane domain-containing protein n=1 Tax=Rickenella mellea TaxID=50990 RepID=A0A4Y7PJV6_9AGAM|nr:hypothetical protein BD410DRAFT_86243 [Rickenella mellea]
MPPEPATARHGSFSLSSPYWSITTLRRRLTPVLTTISHVPTPFITTFLLIHLSAPAMANFGGSELSSQVMLLGREYYQSTPTQEWLLVYTPLLIHFSAGALKRLLSPAPFKISSPRRTLLTLTAYIAPLFLPLHILTNRVHPTSPDIPVLAVGPGELDYEFVKVGLVGEGRWRSWAAYAALVGCVGLHAVEGWSVLWGTWVLPPRQRQRQQQLELEDGGGGGEERRRNSNKVPKRRWVGALGALAVLSGLAVIAQEPLYALPSLVARYRAAYELSPFFRL